MQEISARDIVLLRLAANGLSIPFTKPLDCVRALGGVQSQFQQWAEVSIMNRCAAPLTMGELDERYRGHDILNLWGQRQTLHMYVREDWDTVSDIYEPWLSEKKSIGARFLDDFPEFSDRLAGECALNPLPKAKMLEMIEERAQGRHPENEYLAYSVILTGCLRGLFFGLPEKPGIKTFVGRSSLGLEPWNKDAARAAPAREDFMLRYFRYYGPATLADFSHWSGLSQTDAKKTLASLRDRLTVYSQSGREYFSVAEKDAEAPDGKLFLLGKFDPLFVSYRHKDWIIPPELEKQVWRKAGWVEAVIVDGDKAVGTWRHTVKGRKMSLEVSQFTKIKAASRKKLQARAERLATFWEKTLDTVTFS